MIPDETDFYPVSAQSENGKVRCPVRFKTSAGDLQRSPFTKAWTLRTAISRALGTARIVRADVHDDPKDSAYHANKRGEDVITGKKVRIDRSMRWPVFWLGVMVILSPGVCRVY